MENLLKTVMLLIGAWGLVCFFAWYKQDSLLLYPSDSIELHPELNAVHDQKGAFIGWRTKIENPLGVVFFVHGNAGDAKGRIGMALILKKMGYETVLLEYPGFPNREGSIAYETFAKTLLSDITLLRTGQNGRLVLMGESFGAGVCAKVMELDHSFIDSVVLITPWDNLSKLAGEKMPLLPTSWILKDEMDSVEAMRRNKVPLTVIASQHDEVIPFKHAQRLAEEVKANFIILPEAGHNDWLVHLPSEALRAAIENNQKR